MVGLAARGLIDLQSCVEYLRQRGRLTVVNTPVDSVLELCGVAQKLEGGNPVLFKHVKGSDYPLATGLYWNRDIVGLLFDTPARRVPFLMAEAVNTWRANPLEPVVVPSGPANEVVEHDLDLRKLPAPVHALADGGHYLDSSVVFAKDPDTGVRNASIHRFLITGPNRMTMQLDEGRHLRDYYERAEKRGAPLEITINNGVDPAIHFAACVPSSAAPIDRDELGVASQLLGEPLQLIKAQTVGVEAAAHAQFVIEGRILPDVREPEGPFGEVTGYYATPANKWTVEVTAITRRRQPTFHTILPGIEVYNCVGLLGEANVFNLVSAQVPGIKEVFFTYGGCGFYHAVVAMAPKGVGWAKQAIMATFAAFPPLKMVTVVDDDVDIYNPSDVEWALATRFSAAKDLILIPDARGHELNPMAAGGLSSKLGLDATAPYPRPKLFERVQMQAVDLSQYDIETGEPAPVVEAANGHEPAPASESGAVEVEVGVPVRRNGRR